MGMLCTGELQCSEKTSHAPVSVLERAERDEPEVGESRLDNAVHRGDFEPCEEVCDFGVEPFWVGALERELCVAGFVCDFAIVCAKTRGLEWVDVLVQVDEFFNGEWILGVPEGP